MSLEKMDFDSEVYFLETTPLLKLLLFGDEKDCWINPIYKERTQHGEFHTLFPRLLEQPVKFFEYHRMASDTFYYILNEIRDSIEKQSNFRKCISPEERLSVTLRFLSTGIAFRSLAFSTRIAHNTISDIVYETCDAIWDKFVCQHMPVLTTDILMRNSQEFENIWNFPNCVGAIDGKHVRIKCPKSSGSQFYNYKNYFSINFQAIVDAKYKFMTVDIGAYGRQSDSNVLTNSNIFRQLEVGTLRLPLPRKMTNSDITLPYVLIGDQGYPLKEYLMRPYPTDERICRQREIFNYRLSRARRTVECAFGILVSKWRCLKTELQISPAHVNKIVKTVCLLHNIVIDKEGFDETV